MRVDFETITQEPYMPQSYKLARTYAPTDAYESCLESLEIDAEQLCRYAGVHPATYKRVQKRRTVSRATAKLIACGVAMVHGAMPAQVAFGLLFTPNPPVIMEQREGIAYFRRRGDA